jgi:hypothetical protein
MLSGKSGDELSNKNYEKGEMKMNRGSGADSQ